MKTLSFKNVSKSYNGLPALSDVTLTLSGQRVHALMGENGAGKSTLIKLIAGVVRADGLDVTRDGTPVPLATPQDAQNAGFRFIHQELNIVPQVSVAENILLGRRYPRRWGMAVNWPLVRAQARQALSFLGADHIDVLSLAGDLAAGDKMLIKIAAALVSDPEADLQADLYVLDEPTAALTDEESEMLFAVIARLKATGAAILYVSHRLDEVLRISDDVTVLRDGRWVSTNATQDVTKDQIIRDMTGRDIKDAYPKSQSTLGPHSVADFKDVDTATLSGLNFTLQAGEILGIAGLAEAGQSAVLEMFMGLHPIRAGHGHYFDQKLPENPAEAWARGIAYLPKERRSEGLMLDMSIRANITAPHLGAYGMIANLRRERRDAVAMSAKMRMKYDDIEQPVGQLSGGNQQKVVFARALYGNPKLLLLNEPTRGVDVGAKYEIYTTVRELSAQGCGIVLTSSDLPEVLGMCDRILVLQDGRQKGLFTSAALTTASLLSQFYGSGAEEQAS